MAAAAITKHKVESLVAKQWWTAFWGDVDETRGHWLWRGAVDARGRGFVVIGKTRFAAHELALAYDGQDVAPRSVAGTTCVEPRCIRPQHQKLREGGRS